VSSNGYWIGNFSPGVRRPGHEANHSAPSSPRLRMRGAKRTSLTSLHGVMLNYA
jgi:hypothetical protein